MNNLSLGSLDALPLLEHLDLVAAPTAAAISNWPGIAATDAFGVAAIDPDLADTAAFCEHYGVGLDVSANCVILECKREGKRWLAACVILATTRADVNGLARRKLGASKISFAPMDKAVEQTGMEYGGITPIGLPADWPILIDSAVIAHPRIIIGSGLRRSKLIVPGKALAELPSALILENLGR
ncbi:MAG TPA: YbaK/EbsC family protein [Nevskiaceae bacterium]|nr:YbaK/EbsC family protein [Nevskiaceae bacterium]